MTNQTNVQLSKSELEEARELQRQIAEAGDRLAEIWSKHPQKGAEPSVRFDNQALQELQLMGLL